MAADFRFVMHTAQADMGEFPFHRACDGLPERSLAHTGRADKAKDGCLSSGCQFANRQIFDDTLLYLFQPVMIRIENAPGLRNVDRRFFRQCPRQLDQPIEIGAHHAVFAGGLRHPFQPLQLLAGLIFHLARHFRPGDGLGKLRNFCSLSVFAVFAKLALDCCHLFAQENFALAFVQRGFRLLPDLL